MNQNNSLSSLGDLQLVRMVKDGDGSAFEEISHRYRNFIHSVARRFCSEEDELCDFTQEGLLGLLSACKTFKEENGASFKNYAALCIKRRLISLKRKQSSGASVPKSSMISIEDVEIPDRDNPDPEELIVSRERLDEMLIQLKNQAGGKSMNEILPFLLAATSGMKKDGVSFSQDEFRLIFDVLKQGKSGEEVDRMNRMVQLFQMMHPAGHS